jgi:hypothetical protein
MLNGRWQKVEEVLLTHYHAPDIEAARALYSAFAAHQLSGSPVWPMIVAPPGSLKTEMLKALEGEKGTHFIDQITPNTFISGQIERPGAASKDPPGLLHRIGASGIMVFSDFSTILAMPTDRRGGILADMRRIYDGSLHKEFGTAATRKSREWKGRITFIVAATPDVDRYYSIFQSLGERFVMVRCSRPNGTQAALAAMRQDGTQARQELRNAVRNLLAGLRSVEPQSPDNIEKQIAALAELVVRARTHVPRDGHKKEIRYVPEAEAPTRLAQQLAQLSKGSALLDDRDTMSGQDYKLVRRVGMDCIPAARRKVLEYLISGEESKLAGLPPSTRSYAEEELEAHGLVTGRGDSANLSLEALALMSTAGLF